MAKKDKPSPSMAENSQNLRPETEELIFEYVANIENSEFKTSDIAAAVGLSERHTRRFLTPAFWDKSLAERRKQYKKHAHFVDEGLVKSAARGNPQAAKLFYDRYDNQKDDKSQFFEWIARTKEYALKDVAFHREVLYGSTLYHPEIEAIRLVEKHIAAKSGKTITIRSARQTMKNECSAMLCVRALERYKDIGGTYIRTAPTWKPQMINSKYRIERFLNQDPLIAGDFQPREGFIFEKGLAQVQLLSSDKKASVVGATASICLDIDEAHKVDKGKFQEDFSPMTASMNAPVVMWGMASDKQDLLYEYLSHNLEHDPSCVLQYPADIWCELIPSYAKHYQEQVSRLGADHPVILTQYDLVDVESIGGYLNKFQQESLISGTHPQQSKPKGSKSYIFTIDIAGEAEEEEVDPLKKSRDSRDSTTVLIWEADYRKLINNLPMCRLVNIHWWTGKPLSDGPSGLPGQQSVLLKLLNTWKPIATVSDARGVGEQISKYLEKNWAGVDAYAASSESVSEDCYGFLAMVNNDRAKFFRDDGSPEYKELCQQIKHTRYESKHGKIKIIKPLGKGHIDMVKALTYLYRAVNEDYDPTGGITI